MTNRLEVANNGLWAVLSVAFAGSAIAHNPGGHQRPKPRDGQGLAGYVAQTDDLEPEVISSFVGNGGFDLKLEPKIEIAFIGGSKDDRTAAAWAAIETLKTAIAADRSLGGTVEHSQLELPSVIATGAQGADWMAGGLEIPVRLLFNAPTQAG